MFKKTRILGFVCEPHVRLFELHASLVHMKRVSIACVAMLACAGSSASAAEQAATCESFVAKFGISNAHPDQASYLVDLGLRNYRTSLQIVSDSAINTAYDAYGLSGCFLGLGTKEPSVPDTIARLKGLERGAIYCFEGPNEVNNTGIGGFTYHGASVTDTNVDPAVNYMNDVGTAMRADPATADIPMACFTQINAGVKFGGRFPFDFENAHPYPGYGPATYGYGPARDLAGTSYGSMAWNIRFTDGLEVAPGGPKPIVATETGYSVDKMTTLAQSKYVPKLLADYFVHGRHPRVYLFTLANEVNYGLLDDMMNKRPAYYAVKSLINTLADATWNTATKAWETVAFTPGSLDYKLEGAPTSIDHALLQKGAGDFYLLLWNEVPVHAANNGQNFGADVSNAAVPVTLRLGDPSIAAATIYTQGNDGKYTSTQPAIVGGSLQLAIPDSFMIVRLSGRPPFGGADAGAGVPWSDAGGEGGGGALEIDASVSAVDGGDSADAKTPAEGGNRVLPDVSGNGSGCSCQTAGTSSGNGFGALAILGLLLGRRRQRGPRGEIEPSYRRDAQAGGTCRGT